MPANAPAGSDSAPDHRAEIADLRRLCKRIDTMPEGARGRALRWILSKYEREIRECGLRGEP